MQNCMRIILAAVCLIGCAQFKDHFQNPFQDPYPNLVETQHQLVTGCHMLGTLAETADADRVLAGMAERAMVNKVKERAVQLGATHIVWLHRTDTSAAAQAYRCPMPSPTPERPNPEPDLQ